MERFQKIVLTIAIVILLVVLLVIGITLLYSSKHQKWPPIDATCPDYWKITGSDKNTTCVNVKNLGTCPAPSGQNHLTMNFNQPPYIGSNGLCSKYQWASRCNLSWDGITYGVNNPCDSNNSSSSSGGSGGSCNN